METSTVRKRLEEACHELDKSIEVLRGEKPAVSGRDFPQDPADAGTNLSEDDRTKLQAEYDALLGNYFQMDEGKQSKEK